MSAPVAEAVLRELHCQARTFGSVRAAMLWYRDQLAARLRAGRDPAAVGGPTSQEKRDQTAATFAAIAACLTERHPVDVEPDGLVFAPKGRWKHHRTWGAGESLVWLISWYENTEDDGSEMAVKSGLQTRDHDGAWLAREAGLERRSFHRRCKRVASVLRVRMLSCGLLLDSDGR